MRLEGRVKASGQDVNSEDSFNTNAFMQFAKASLSPEKQKLITFYSSANTLKGLRGKIQNGNL